MARTAQSKPIGGVVAQFGKWSPRFHVVNLKFAAALTASLASPVVSLKNSISELFVLRRVMRLASDGGVSTLPVRMICTNKMKVARRLVSGTSDTLAYGLLCCVGVLASLKCLRHSRDGLLSGGRCHQLCLSPAVPGMLSNLGSDLWVLGNIVIQIPPTHLARV